MSGVIFRAARTILEVLAAFVILFIISLAGLVRVNGGQFLSVQTGSMVPVIHRGDMVVVLPIAAVNVHRGDIITFHNPAHLSQTISHRVVSIQKTQKMVQTKGDANQAPDMPISMSMVVGKMQYHIPKLGYVAGFIRRPIGLALVIYVPALGILLAEMQRLARHYRKQQPYTAIGYRRNR
jgi:signal peptidase I